jgi:Ca2+-binding EF-hand superfamily protein
MIRGFGLTALVAAFLLAGSAGTGGEKQDQPKKEKGTSDLDAVFKKLDADGDGKISPEEFRKLPNFYKPERRGGFGGFGGFDPEQLKKLIENFGGGGNFDPEQLKKMLERFKGKGKAGKGNFDPERLKKLLERFGGEGGFDLEQLKKLIEQFKGKEEQG